MKFIILFLLLGISIVFSVSNIYAEDYPIMVSVSPDGEPGNEDSFLPSFNSNGARVVFMSRADNLVEDDRNHQMDIFVRDIVNKDTYLVSISSDGTQGASENNYPTISGDGNLVTFYTRSNFDSMMLMKEMMFMYIILKQEKLFGSAFQYVVLKQEKIINLKVAVILL